MCSLGAARAALDVVVSTFGAPLLPRAPERLLRPDEEEDDRGKDREVDGRAEPVLFIRIRCVLVDNEPLIRAFRDLAFFQVRTLKGLGLVNERPSALQSWRTRGGGQLRASRPLTSRSGHQDSEQKRIAR